MVDHLSNLLMRESSDFDESTDEDIDLEFVLKDAATDKLARGIFHSNLSIDQSLANIYIVKRIKEDRKFSKYNRKNAKNKKRS